MDMQFMPIIDHNTRMVWGMFVSRCESGDVFRYVYEPTEPNEG